MPGALSPATGLVKNANSVWLNGRPLRQDLERLLHRPLRFANDANCFALSEARDGAGAGARTVFGVILGTGTGGGIVVDGRALTGPNAIAGEWGHNPLPWPRPDEWPGAACYCGRTGCIETFLSGPGIARDHREATGETLDAATIATRAAGRRRAMRGHARPLRGAPRAGAGRRRQRPRSGRHRAGRRPLEPGPPLRARCRPDGVPGCSRTASTLRCAPRATAIRAGSGARRGSGRPSKTTGSPPRGRRLPPESRARRAVTRQPASRIIAGRASSEVTRTTPGRSA